MGEDLSEYDVAKHPVSEVVRSPWKLGPCEMWANATLVCSLALDSVPSDGTIA